MCPDEITEGDEQAFYTTAEATRALAVSRQRIHQLLNDGLLTGYQDARTKRWHIDRQSVLSYARMRAATQHQPRLQALEAEVRELLRRLGAAESRIAVLDSIRRERDLLGEELALTRSELSEVRQELFQLAAFLKDTS